MKEAVVLCVRQSEKDSDEMELNTNRKLIENHIHTGERPFWGERIARARAPRQEYSGGF